MKHPGNVSDLAEKQHLKTQGTTEPAAVIAGSNTVKGLLYEKVLQLLAILTQFENQRVFNDL